jgi:hypothetical protein
MGMPFVSNSDKFLDGMPTLSAKEQQKQGNTGLFLTKEMRLQQQ